MGSGCSQISSYSVTRVEGRMGPAPVGNTVPGADHNAANLLDNLVKETGPAFVGSLQMQEAHRSV